jgi:hypothetical protein
VERIEKSPGEEYARPFPMNSANKANKEIHWLHFVPVRGIVTSTTVKGYEGETPNLGLRQQKWGTEGEK